MKKTLVFTALALALSAGLPFTPLALATEGILQQNLESSAALLTDATSERLPENAVLPMLRFNRIDAGQNQIGFIFNLAGSEKYQLTRLVVASYRYDEYTQAMVEREISQLQSGVRPTWAETWSDNHFEVNAGIYLDETFKLKDSEAPERNLLANRPGIIYYAAEYQNNGTAEWLFGKLNYRRCAQVDNSGDEVVGTYCMVFPNSDGSKWSYSRFDSSVIGMVNTWPEELAGILQTRLTDLETEVSNSSSEMTEAEQSRFYQQLLQIRELTADVAPEQAEEILRCSRDAYNLIFGEYEEGYGPSTDAPEVPEVPEVPQPPVDTPTPPTETPEEKPEDKPDNKPKDDLDDSSVTGKPSGDSPDKGDGKDDLNTPAGGSNRPAQGNSAGNLPNASTGSTGGANTTDRNPNNQGAQGNQANLIANTVRDEQKTPVSQDGQAAGSIEKEEVIDGDPTTSNQANANHEVQVPTLSNGQAALAVSHKAWWWPFWLLLASVLAILGWLGARIYKRRRKF